nr:basic salivary proline-rich protein 1-like [Gorilla gorilla gorilla]
MAEQKQLPGRPMQKALGPALATVPAVDAIVAAPVLRRLQSSGGSSPPAAPVLRRLQSSGGSSTQGAPVLRGLQSSGGSSPEGAPSSGGSSPQWGSSPQGVPVLGSSSPQAVPVLSGAPVLRRLQSSGGSSPQGAPVRRGLLSSGDSSPQGAPVLRRLLSSGVSSPQGSPVLRRFQSSGVSSPQGAPVLRGLQSSVGPQSSRGSSPQAAPVLRGLQSSGGSCPQGVPVFRRLQHPRPAWLHLSPWLGSLHPCVPWPPSPVVFPRFTQYGPMAQGDPLEGKHLNSRSTEHATFSLCAHLCATSPAEVAGNGAVPIQRHLLQAHHGANSVQKKRINACGTEGVLETSFQPTDPPCTSLMHGHVHFSSKDFIYNILTIK